MTNGSIRVLAHRGASAAEPENTIAAFAAARRLGADGVELDVRRTADGALAVHHDAHLADGRALVDLGRADLPAHVPLLEKALAACSPLLVNVEIKNLPMDPDYDEDDQVAAAVVDLLRRTSVPGGVIVSSFNLRTIDRVRDLDPSIPTAWLVMAAGPEVLDRCVRHGHHVLHPFHAGLDPGAIAAAHDAGVEVNTWTVDDPDRIRALADAGVDAIVTNVPDVALSALGRAGPAPRG